MSNAIASLVLALVMLLLLGATRHQKTWDGVAGSNTSHMRRYARVTLVLCPRYLGGMPYWSKQAIRRQQKTGMIELDAWLLPGTPG